MDQNNNLPEVKILHPADLFAGLSGDEMADLLGQGRSIKLLPKDVLFTQGDPATSCFLVQHGRLRLTKFNELGKEILLRYIDEGELTAAMAVFKTCTYPVTAEAIAPTIAIGWDKVTMLQLMRRYPDIAINLLGIVIERLDDIQHRYLELCSEPVDQRIARSLIRLMRKIGTKIQHGISIDLALSRQNIADYSGTTIYTVSRTLSAWEKKGWIVSKRERIIIKAPHALVHFAESGGA